MSETREFVAGYLIGADAALVLSALVTRAVPLAIAAVALLPFVVGVFIWAVAKARA